MKYKNNIVMQVYLPCDVYDKLKQNAAKHGLSISSYVRSFLLKVAEENDNVLQNDFTTY